MGMIDIKVTAVGNQAVCGAFLQSSRGCRFYFPSCILFYKLQCLPNSQTVFSKHSFLRHVLHCQAGKWLRCRVLCLRFRARFPKGLRWEQPCSLISSCPHLLTAQRFGFLFPSRGMLQAQGCLVAAASLDGPRLLHSRAGERQGSDADIDLSAQHRTEWRDCWVWG